MKTYFIYLFFFFYLIGSSQNNLVFNEKELSDKTILIAEIAEQLLDKNGTITNVDWFKNSSQNLVEELREFQLEIKNSDYKLNYYIDRNVYESKNEIYSIHFFIEHNEEQFSKIYFLLRYDESNNDNKLKVDEIKIDGKMIIDEMKKEWGKQMGTEIPPPPLPPSKND
jgi:hypothetical protein